MVGIVWAVGRARAPARFDRSFYALLLASWAGLFCQVVQAMPANPLPVTLVQPDGRLITLKVMGDEYGSWYVDLNGYPVVSDGLNRYVYATLTASNALAGTILQVGRSNPAASGGLIQQNVRPTTFPGKALCRPFEETSGSAPPPGSSGAGTTNSGAEGGVAPVPPNGTVNNLVILCRFSDHTLGVHTRDPADYNTLFNAVGGDPILAPSGSVRDYFLEASYGILTFDSMVVAWVTLPNTEAYYANGNDGLGAYPQNAQRMVEDALNAVNPLVDFGAFDQDNDGYIDSITIIHSGYGSEAGGSGGNRIWSHRWGLPSDWSSGDINGLGASVKVNDYHTEPALWDTSGTNIVRIGVICHETGHFFGLPDWYDTDGTSEGIGSWCLMANSWGFDFTQLHPPHPSALGRIELGWVLPTQIVVDGTYTAPRVQDNPTIFKIDHGYASGEYLLIENREPFGVDSVIPQGGLAIWHIDENKANNRGEGYPGQGNWPTNGNHYQNALLQADGDYDLEHGNNRGDSGDMYHAAGVGAITPTNSPSTCGYQGGVVTNTGVSITSISSAGDNMTFIVSGLGAPAVAVIRLSGDLDYGSVVVGATSNKSFTIHNDGTAPLTVDSVDYSAGYSGMFTGAIAEGSSTNVVVQFAPPMEGAYDGELSVASDAAAGSGRLPLSGFGSLYTYGGPGGSTNIPMTFNPQTGLFEQRVSVSNATATALSGVKIFATGMPDGISFWNCTGTNSLGESYYQYDGTIAAGASAEILLEYYSAYHVVPDPQLRGWSSLSAAPVVLTGSPIGIARTILSGPRKYIEITNTVPGSCYQIQYSSNLVNWTAAGTPVKAGGTSLIWEDSGPPKTYPHPSAAPSRFYQAIPVTP